MLRRHVLAALAVGISAGDDDAARAYLKTIDFVLRGAAKRRMEAALIDAQLATAELTGVIDPEAARHVQRAAALAISSVTVGDWTDRITVAAAYAKLPRVRLGGAPVATALLAASLAVVVATITLLFVFAPNGAPRTYHRPLPPPTAGAFKDGGQPLIDTAIARFLEDEFTQFMIETDRDRNTGGQDKARAAHAQRLLAPSVITARGPALAKAWSDMVTMLDKWAHIPSSSMEFERIVRELRHRVRDVSDQFAAAGIGYYLEGDVLEGSSGAHALIYAYRVEEVVFVIAHRPSGPERRRVLSLRRVDRLNLTHSLLGMQSAELGDPVLLLDQIDNHVSSEVLPVLAKGATFPLGDARWLATPAGKELSALAGLTIRDELDKALGADAPAASEIATLLFQRGALVAEWSEVMRRRGWRLSHTDDLFLPPDLLGQLEGLVPRATLDRGAAIEERLAVLQAPRIASRVHQLVAATVRRHEAQHGLDEERPAPLRYPEALSSLLGSQDANGKPRRSVVHARAELSAYVSQLANDPVTPQLSLWSVVRFAFDDNTMNTPESYAGVVLAESLARRLGIPSPGPVIHERRLDRDRLAAIMRPMVLVPGSRIRTAAQGVWSDLFAEAIVPIAER